MGYGRRVGNGGGRRRERKEKVRNKGEKIIRTENTRSETKV